MRKSAYIFIILLLIIVIAAFLGSEKLYPVAIVNGSLIWKRTWERYLNGTNHALLLQAQKTNQPFNIDTSLLVILKKNTLAALIENKVIAQNADDIISDFTHTTEQHIKTAIGTSTTVGKAAQFVYGFSERDFHDFILLPESRREVAQSKLEQQHLNYDAWLASIKRNARVYIFIRGYSWDGSGIN